MEMTTNKSASAGPESLDCPPHRQRRNIRRDDREWYNGWREQKQHSQMQVHDVYGNGDKGLREYIRQVEAGTHPMRRRLVAGALTEPEPMDPVREELDQVNTVESTLEWYAQHHTVTGADGDDYLDETRLGMRPLWEVSEFELPNSPGHRTGWRLPRYDPADAWADALDHREQKVACIHAALKLPKRQRQRELDRLLDAFSHAGDDPDFAALLLEWVCDQVPGYQLHCEAKLSRIHQRGRHKATEDLPLAA